MEGNADGIMVEVGEEVGGASEEGEEVEGVSRHNW